MAFNPFAISSERSSELSTKLGIDIGCRAYVFQTSKGLSVKEIYEISEADYNQLKLELQGLADGDISQGDRVFIAPGSMITGDRWSMYLKKVGATQVSDVNKATLIIQCGKYEEDKLGYGTQARLSSQLMSGHMRIVKEEESIYTAIPVATPAFIHKFGLDHIWFSGSTAVGTHRGAKSYMIYPFTLEVIDKVRSGTPIINEDAFVAKTTLGTVLDEEKCATIINMLKSNDAGNAEVARQILFQCDIPASWYYIYRIAESGGGYGVHHYGRDKNGHLFIEKSDYSNLQRMSPNEFANFMQSKGLLTEEIFRKLKQEIAATAFEQALNINDFYDVKLVIKPQYQHLDPNMELLDAALSDAIKSRKDYEDEPSEVEEDPELERV